MRSFIWGALIGAGLALLYAPATGDRTRSLIRDKATKFGNDVSDFVDSKQRHLQNKMEGYRAKARRMASRMQEKLAQSSEQHDMAATGEPSI